MQGMNGGFAGGCEVTSGIREGVRLQGRTAKYGAQRVCARKRSLFRRKRGIKNASNLCGEDPNLSLFASQFVTCVLCSALQVLA
jgi:hypothetical protein